MIFALTAPFTYYFTYKYIIYLICYVVIYLFTRATDLAEKMKIMFDQLCLIPWTNDFVFIAICINALT